MRVFKFFAIAVIVLAAGRARGEEVTYDPTTGDLDLVQDSTWATQSPSGLGDFEIYFAGTDSNNYAPSPSVYEAPGTLYANTPWSVTSYYGPGIENDLSAVAGDIAAKNKGPGTLAAGTYLIATLPTGLGAPDFGSSYNGTSGDAIGSVFYANYSGAETPDQVTVLGAVPEPSTLMELFGVGIAGVVGFAGRRLRKVAV
jgi:hypothetical protein